MRITIDYEANSEEAKAFHAHKILQDAGYKDVMVRHAEPVAEDPPSKLLQEADNVFAKIARYDQEQETVDRYLAEDAKRAQTKKPRAAKRAKGAK